MKIELAKTEVIHFVGIGGIGMSGLSLIMRGMGFNVQGSDISNNKNIERLKKNKVKVSIKHTKKNIEKAQLGAKIMIEIICIWSANYVELLN